MGLNRERIIRGLACCKGSYDCFTCDIYKRGCAGFREGLAKDALSLINELTEENERLRAENEALAISKVKECEISQMLVYRIRDKHPAVMAVIADTVRKMQERLTTFFSSDDMLKYNEVDADYINEQIRRIAEELIKGEVTENVIPKTKTDN